MAVEERGQWECSGQSCATSQCRYCSSWAISYIQYSHAACLGLQGKKGLLCIFFKPGNYMIFFCSLKRLEISILQKEGTISPRRKGDFLGIEPNQDTGHLAPIIFCAIDSPSAFWQVIYSPLILCAAAVSRDNNRSLHHGANVRVSLMVSAQLLHNVLVGWRDYCPQTLPGSCPAL